MTKELTRSAIRVYGALTAFEDDSGDVLKKLLPFFDSILRRMEGERFNSEKIIEEAKRLYRWNLNTDIVDVFIPRFVEAGWLTSTIPELSGTLLYTVTVPAEYIPEEFKVSATDQLREIAEEFKRFSEALSPQPLVAMPSKIEEFEDILIEWLLYMEAYSEKNLNLAEHSNEDESETFLQDSGLDIKHRYLCAKFVHKILQKNPEISDILVRLASIGLLTEVVQDFIAPTASQVGRSDLVLYLDAPVAMELLQVSGKPQYENIKPIISELQRIGVSVRVYEQSVDEIKRTLKAVIGSSNPTGPTARAITLGHVKKDYVRSVAKDPKTHLKKLKVEVDCLASNQMSPEHDYSSDECCKQIYNVLSFHSNSKAREHDAQITTSLIRQRGGYNDADLFKSKFLITTKNDAFYQKTRDWCLESRSIDSNTVPPVIHQRVIAAATWLRTGLSKDGTEVPKRMLLAGCESVLGLRPDVVKAVQDLADECQDEGMAQQIEALANEDRSGQMLMDMTLGSTGVLNEVNTEEVIKHLLYTRMEKQRKKDAKKMQIERKKVNKDVKKIKKDLASTKAQKENLSLKISSMEKEDEQIFNNFALDVTRSVRRHVHLLKFRCWIVAFVLASFTCYGSHYVSQNLFFSISLGIIATVLGYFTIAGKGLLRTDVSEEEVNSIFNKMVKKRNLDTKLSRYNVKPEWNGSEFEMSYGDDNGRDKFTNHKN